MLTKEEASISTTKVKSSKKCFLKVSSYGSEAGYISYWQLNLVMYKCFSGGTGIEGMKGSLRGGEVLP